MDKPIKIIIGIIIVVIIVWIGYTILGGKNSNNQNNTNNTVSPQVSNTNNGQSDHSKNGNEGSIPQNGDLCGDTGGNGQIVSMGNNSITIKLSRNGRLLKKGSSQVFDITPQTTIKTPTGSGAISDLKTGDNVTVGGKPNSDGSFTAMIVVVCN